MTKMCAKELHTFVKYLLKKVQTGQKLTRHINAIEKKEKTQKKVLDYIVNGYQNQTNSRLNNQM